MKIRQVFQTTDQPTSQIICEDVLQIFHAIAVEKKKALYEFLTCLDCILVDVAGNDDQKITDCLNSYYLSS